MTITNQHNIMEKLKENYIRRIVHNIRFIIFRLRVCSLKTQNLKDAKSWLLLPQICRSA